MRIDVTDAGYLTPARSMAGARQGLDDVHSALVAALAGSAAMAGSDSGGSAWAAGYDKGARACVIGLHGLGQGAATLSSLLDASFANHAAAESASASRTSLAAHPFPAQPLWEECPVTPPSAAGAPSEAPAWFGQLASHLQGAVWPGGDSGRLRAAATAWSDAARDVAGQAAMPRAAAEHLDGIVSTEIPAAVTVLRRTAQATDDLSAMCASLADACREYADHIDAAHEELWELARDFARDTLIVELAGAILIPLTAGISEALAQAAETSRGAAVIAAMIARIGRFVEDVGTLVARVSDVTRRATGVNALTTRLASARLVRATTNAVSDARASASAYSRALGRAVRDHPPTELMTVNGAFTGGEWQMLAETPAWLRRVLEGTRWHRVEQERLLLDSGGEGVAELYVAKPAVATGERPAGANRLDFYLRDVRILSMKHTQLAEVKLGTVERYLREIETKYPPGTPIRDVPSTPRDLVGRDLRGEMILHVPPQQKPIPSSILDLADRYDVTILEGEGLP